MIGRLEKMTWFRDQYCGSLALHYLLGEPLHLSFR
jgi:hypothetical protein